MHHHRGTRLVPLPSVPGGVTPWMRTVGCVIVASLCFFVLFAGVHLSPGGAVDVLLPVRPNSPGPIFGADVVLRVARGVPTMLPTTARPARESAHAFETAVHTVYCDGVVIRNGSAVSSAPHHVEFEHRSPEEILEQLVAFGLAPRPRTAEHSVDCTRLGALGGTCLEVDCRRVGKVAELVAPGAAAIPSHTRWQALHMRDRLVDAADLYCEVIRAAGEARLLRSFRIPIRVAQSSTCTASWSKIPHIAVAGDGGACAAEGSGQSAVLLLHPLFDFIDGPSARVGSMQSSAWGCDEEVISLAKKSAWGRRAGSLTVSEPVRSVWDARQPNAAGWCIPSRSPPFWGDVAQIPCQVEDPDLKHVGSVTTLTHARAVFVPATAGNCAAAAFFLAAATGGAAPIAVTDLKARSDISVAALNLALPFEHFIPWPQAAACIGGHNATQGGDERLLKWLLTAQDEALEVVAQNARSLSAALFDRRLRRAFHASVIAAFAREELTGTDDNK